MPNDLEKYLAAVEERDQKAKFAVGDDEHFRNKAASQADVPTLVAMLKAILHYDADGHAFDECCETSVLATLDRLARSATEQRGG